MKYLLDTNVISELRKGRRAHPKVLLWVQNVDVEDICTSVAVLAEIRRGIELKRLKDSSQAEALDSWYRKMRDGLSDRVIPIDERVADRWARLNVPDPLPFVDGLLAATAIVLGLTLVTRDGDVARTGARLLDPFAD